MPERPKAVRDAMVSGDTETLCILASRGGKRAAALRKTKAARAAQEEERLQKALDRRRDAEEYVRRVKANEHICPIDPDEADEEDL